jgi:hypothetical protein
MSLKRDSPLKILLSALLLASFHPATSFALSLPQDLNYEISSTVALQQDSTEIEDLQTSVPTAPITTPAPPANASGNNASSFHGERGRLLQSIQQHIIAKLNMRELPPSTPSLKIPEIPAAVMETYHAHLRALEQGADAEEKCGEEETTRFSRYTKLYNPEYYGFSEPNSDHFELGDGDEKGEEIKNSDKGGKITPSKKSKTKESPLSPVLYNLRFDELDFSSSNRLWSIKLDLYKRKAALESNNKRGINPVDAVKVFRVLRTYAYGQLRKSYVLLASRNVASEDEGYVSFNITSGVKNWLSGTSDETTLELDVLIDTPRRVDTGLSLPPVVRFDIPSHDKGEHDARLLVERLHEIEGVGINSEGYRRRRRQVNNNFCAENLNTTNCCLRNLTIDFLELDLHTTIILPHTFDANYCQGQCRGDWASASRSTSNIMQLRENNPTAAAEPCCVPHKTRPLSVLMVVNGSVQVNDIPDMIVDSCICR